MVAIIVIIPLNIDTHAKTLDEMITDARNTQPELKDGLIAGIKKITKSEFMDKLRKIISFDVSKLIEKLVTNVNSGIKTGEKINLEFLKNIANTLQIVKNDDLLYGNISRSLLALQRYKGEVVRAINASPKKALSSVLWIDSIQEDDFSETKETLVARLESLIIAYLESFNLSHSIKRNKLLQSLTLIIRYGALSQNEEEQIKEAFEKIADNTIGKLLLYRILIEAQKNPFSLYIINAPAFFNTPWDQKSSIYGLGLSLKLSNKLNFPVFSNIEPDSTVMYAENEPDLDLAIFHELVHLFHKLNHYERSIGYSSGKDGSGSSDIRRHPLFLHYYGDHKACDIKKDDRWKTSLYVWSSLKPDNQERVNFEEMLTICGLPDTEFGYLYGDELSENLYRASKNIPLRFGHKLFSFVENKVIKQKVIESIDHYYTTFKELGELSVPTKESNKTKDDYDQHSLGMVKLDGIDGMYFYAIPNYISRERAGLFRNSIANCYIRKDLSNAYYYLKECCCKTSINSLKLD